MTLFLIREPRCVFAHVPKTGGLSIRVALFDRNYEGPCFGELPEEWRSEFAFGFVRNPFDRVVSAWKMFTQGTRDSDWDLPADADPSLSLEDVLRLALDPAAPFGHPRYNGIRPDARVRLKNHVLPQSHPYYGLSHADFVGRFERLQADFDTVAGKLGIADPTLPKTHWTEREHYRSYFDATTRALAEELYAEDLTRFGYAF